MLNLEPNCSFERQLWGHFLSEGFGVNNEKDARNAIQMYHAEESFDAKSSKYSTSQEIEIREPFKG